MSMMVQTSTHEMPELLDVIEHRRANGLDRFDEWWAGVYRIVTGPSPEHGELLTRLLLMMHPLAELAGLKLAQSVNVGVDKFDAKVPDLAAYRPDTERTSRAFLATAELVVEVLSPSERAGEKLPFYAEWHVGEYLEIDLEVATCRLLAHRDGEWVPIDTSEVLGFTLSDIEDLL